MNGIKRNIVTLSLLLALTASAFADEEALVDTGVLYVHGQLQENTCRMDMDSAWQEVDLGSTSRASVNLTGKTSNPVTVKIYLHDCPELSTWSTNITPITTTVSAIQPNRGGG
ncbi:MrfE [Cronobacter turicensis 564]|nr:MrfE [Cronobacter turicensis 564]